MRPMRYQPQGRIQVDWSNPITRGLEFAFVHGSSAVGVSDNRLPTSIPFIGAASSVIGNPKGSAVRSNGTNSSRAYVVPAASMKNNTYSLLAVASSAVGANSQSVLDDDGNSSSRYMQFRSEPNGVGFIVFDTAGTPIIVPPVSFLDGEASNGYVMAATCAPGEISAYLNGRKGVAAIGTPRNLTGNLWVGARKGGTGTQPWLTGGINMVAGWSRTLTDAEMQSLAANPWQLFAAPSGDDVTIASAPVEPGPVTGSLSTTLGQLTGTAAAAVKSSGALAATLGVVTLAAAGSAPASGSLSASLGAVTLSATGHAPSAGGLAATLGSLNLVAAGVVPASGGLAATLGGLTLMATGAAPASALLNRTLAPLTLVGGGSVLPQEEQGTGPNPVSGQLSRQLGALTLAATGTARINGHGISQLGGLTLTATGTLAHAAQLNATLGALSLQAAGGVPAEGGLQVSLGGLTLAASGGMFKYERSLERTYTVKPESRTYVVAPENRTYEVQE